MAKVQFGLRNVYIATVTVSGGTVTYGTPFQLPGAVNLSLSPEGEENVFYADDSRYYVISTNAGYSGTLEIAQVTEKFATDILGYIKDQNNNLIEDKDVQPSAMAIMFEVQQDTSGKRYVFYNVTVGRADVSAATTEDSTEVQTATLDITCGAAVDTGYVKMYTTDTSTNYNTWFSAVPLGNP